MKALNIGGLRIEVPIIQGGMGVGISLSKLASAVANEGGVGVISVAGIGLLSSRLKSNYLESNISALRDELQKVKQMTKGIVGVNIMTALSNFEDMVRTSIEEKVHIIFSGAGLPLDLPKFLKPDSITKLVPIISSGRAARVLCEKWKSHFDYLPDAFVVEGPKAGGHLGFKKNQIDAEEYSLENIIPEVVNEVRIYEDKYGVEIPVIAAGGIYDGEDIYNIMKKGAKGVQLGTRFVTTEECDASDEFKQSYIDSKQSDIQIIQSPVGMPGRAILNSFIEKVNSGLKMPKTCPFKCIKTCEIDSSPYCIVTALYNAFKGKMSSGFAFAGTNAYRATKITTVKEIFTELLEDFRKISIRQDEKLAVV